LSRVTDEGCATAKIGQNKEKEMKNRNLFEALLTKVWPIWAGPPLYNYFGGWPEKPLKYVENTRRYSESPVFFSCFAGFSVPTQLHSETRVRPLLGIKRIKKNIVCLLSR